jgi:hypothetical protein
MVSESGDALTDNSIRMTASAAWDIGCTAGNRRIVL